MNPSITLATPMQPTAGAPGLPSAAPTMKALWIAVVLLGLSVLAIGGTLLRQQPSAANGIVPLASATAMLSPQQALTNSGGMITETKDGKPVPPNPSAAPVVKKANAAPPTKTPAPTRATSPSPSPSPSPAPAPVVAQAPVISACASCGTVEAVTPVTREGKGTGVGVVAGGVLGGVVGNQVGNGNGRTAATVLGAIGGGWAGNEVEKKMKKTTTYSVRVRMEDGTSRTVEQSTAPAVGSKVTLDGGAIRPA